MSSTSSSRSSPSASSGCSSSSCSCCSRDDSTMSDRPAMKPALLNSYVRIENVAMTFQTRKGSFAALKNIDLAVKKGEFVALIGHSGCGKSTLLNLVAGLIKPTEGVLICAEREIAGPGPDRAVVFQNHSLLPWLSCFDNVYLAVERVFGGKEPRAELMVTHDVDEAVLLSDRIVMMTNGPSATIGDVLAVDLLRPRDRIELEENAQYHHYRAAVLAFLYRRQT